MKYLLFSFAVLWVLLISLYWKFDSSSAYVSCSEKSIELKGVNTRNLDIFIRDSHYELVKICSFDICFIRRDESIKKTIADFERYYSMYLSDEDKMELEVKGYPVTSIVVNDC